MIVKDSLCIIVIERKDLGFLRHLRNEPTTWKQLTTVHFITEKEQEDWFNNPPVGQKFYLVETTDEPSHVIPVGMVRTSLLDQQNKSICIGVDIHPDYRGKGYGKATYQLLLKYCFNYLNLNRVWLSVLETNTIAISLYKKVGFILEGRQRQAIFREGKYVDYLMMSILREEYNESTDNL